MGLERLLASSQRDYVIKVADFIEECIAKFQHGNAGVRRSFVLGISCFNGRGRRARLHEILANLGARDNVEWERVYIFLVDERYGYQAEEDSNSNLVRGSLLKSLAKRGVAFPEEHFLVPDVSKESCEECAADYERRLIPILESENGPHLVTIGLGADLHIASIFPEWYKAVPARWTFATRKNFGVLCTQTTIFEVPRRICVNLRVMRKANNILLMLQEQSEEMWERVRTAFDKEFSLDVEHQAKRARTKAMEPEQVMMTADGVFMVQLRGPVQMRRPEAAPDSPMSYLLKHATVSVLQLKEDRENFCNVVIMGAAGDLAKKKTFPALLQLQLGRLLPANMAIFGADDPKFHKDITGTEAFWENRLHPFLLKEKGWLPEDMQEFKDRLSFEHVQLDDAETMKALGRSMTARSKGYLKDNRVFYLALPPFLFARAVEMLRSFCWSGTGFNRVIVEKPFGKNGREADDLSMSLQRHLKESEIFRIDHYLAKTLVLNLLALRFANRELGSLFHANHIANVRITFKESIGVQGRAGYFDGYGIIRDIMQNHLMQVLTLVAMESPASLSAEDVRDEKVKVLKQIRPILPRDCVVGQYEGYQDDPDIKSLNEKKGYASRCATFACAVMYLDNERWSGVPFIMKAGKGLETHHTIVRLQFKKAPPGSLFGDQPQNELVIRIQPNEAIYYKILAKLPGLNQQAKDVQQTVLDLDLKKRFELRRTPEAYEKLIHDVIQGESHNFVRRDELEQAWRIFDPLLEHLEGPEGKDPERYAFGTRGPMKADELIDRLGYRRYSVTGVPGFAETDFD